MEKTNEFMVEPLGKAEMTECAGGWGWIVSATIGLVALAYQAGKDSYHVHPESLI